MVSNNITKGDGQGVKYCTRNMFEIIEPCGVEQREQDPEGSQCPLMSMMCFGALQQFYPHQSPKIGSTQQNGINKIVVCKYTLNINGCSLCIGNNFCNSIQ